MNVGRGTLGILGLVLSAAVLIVTVWLLLRTSRVDAPPTRLPDGVPADVARDPRAARQQVLHETCTAQCASDDRMCRGTVIDPGGESRCADALAACRRACP